MEMIIRRANPADCNNIMDLLMQVERIHHAGRPDIFRENGIKFSLGELLDIMADEKSPIFVAELDSGVVGYIFCVINEISDHTMLNNAKTLHLEDVCVDEKHRGANIGGRLMAFVKDYAKEIGCQRIDLDVWEFNSEARGFYEKQGFAAQKRRMDINL